MSGTGADGKRITDSASGRRLHLAPAWTSTGECEMQRAGDWKIKQISLRNSTAQFTHGPPSIISKHLAKLAYCRWAVITNEERHCLGRRSQQKREGGKKNSKRRTKSGVLRVVSHLSVKTLRSDKRPTPQTYFLEAFQTEHQYNTAATTFRDNFPSYLPPRNCLSVQVS